MRRLSIAQKLLLICAAFLLPLLVQLTIMLLSFQEQIDKAESERAGNLFLAPVRLLLTRVPEHGRLVHLAATGTAGLEPQITALGTEIDAAFGTLTSEARKYGRAFRLEAKELAAAGRERTDPEGIRRRWEQVHTTWSRVPVEANDKAHRELAGDLNLLLQQVGEASGLYLDPDLDSFYVMDASIRALQRVHAQIALALLLGTTAPADPAWPDDVRGRLVTVGQQLRDVNLARVREEVTAALREDNRSYGVSAVFQREVPPRLADFTTAVGQFVGLMEAAYKDPARTPAPATFLAAGERARQGGAALWDSLSVALDDLLLRRVAHHRNRRLAALVLSFLALVVAVAMVASVARGITRPLDRVMDVAIRLSTGDVAGAQATANGLGNAAATAKDGSRDEVWRLAGAFTEMALSLIHI